jgi:hypothetical protein
MKREGRGGRGMEFSLDVLKIDPAMETQRVASFVAKEVKEVYRRSGLVVGLSGGIDYAGFGGRS